MSKGKGTGSLESSKLELKRTVHQNRERCADFRPAATHHSEHPSCAFQPHTIDRLRFLESRGPTIHHWIRRESRLAPILFSGPMEQSDFFCHPLKQSALSLNPRVSVAA